MEKIYKSLRELEVGKDYINKNGLIVIDRIGDYGNRGFDGNNFEYDLFCSSPYVWREATEEEVIEAFKKHLVYRYGEDWETMKIKERHPASLAKINDGSWNMEISKLTNGWGVRNKNGLLYYDGIWVERLEEEEKLEKTINPPLLIADVSKSLTPHRCPVCSGNGLVPNGFYMQTGGHWSTSSITPETCRSCGGTGIVWG